MTAEVPRCPRAPKPGRSLTERHPALAAEWHPTLNGDVAPEGVSYGSLVRVWWRCSFGHVWQAPVNRRSAGHGCPKCRPVPRPGASVAARCPELAAEWHPTLNGERTSSDVSYGSLVRVWWLCAVCGHAWNALLSNRVHGSGCPECARKRGRQPRGPRVFISFAERHPELVSEWHPTKNGDLTPDAVAYGTAAMVWWVCEVGHVWEARVGARHRGSGCHECAVDRRRKTPAG